MHSPGSTYPTPDDDIGAIVPPVIRGEEEQAPPAPEVRRAHVPPEALPVDRTQATAWGGEGGFEPPEAA